jgi:cell wall-associated NlpC family hydrolase
VQGDTLSSIAQRKHLSVDQLVRYNHLSNANDLSEGQVLKLAAPHRAAAVHHTVAVKHVGKVARRVALAQHTRIRHSRSSAHVAMEQRQALWVALHTGTSTPDFFEPSFNAAQRALALELGLTNTALRYLGVPYAWGGESFSGVDCSGFVQAVFRRNGVELPRTADAQFEVGHHVSASGLLPGDLVFFETYAEGASHVGIYLGGGRFVHASASDGVRIDSLSEDYYSSRYLGARREAL